MVKKKKKKKKRETKQYKSFLKKAKAKENNKTIKKRRKEKKRIKNNKINKIADVYQSSKVLLNMPTASINNLDSSSVLYQKLPMETMEAFGAFISADSLKYYLIYEDAWWITKLNLKTGDFVSMDYPPLRGFGTKDLCWN